MSLLILSVFVALFFLVRLFVCRTLVRFSFYDYLPPFPSPPPPSWHSLPLPNPPDPLVAQVLRCATHRAVNCDDLHPDRYLGGTSCLTGQDGRVKSRQCRMSPPVSTRWACAPAAIGRCARVAEARKKVVTGGSIGISGRPKRAHKHKSI